MYNDVPTFNDKGYLYKADVDPTKLKELGEGGGRYSTEPVNVELVRTTSKTELEPLGWKIEPKNRQPK